MFVDENNHPGVMTKAKQAADLGEEMPVNDRLLTVTGCVFAMDSYFRLQEEVVNLKRKYWAEGRYYHEKERRWKCVCLHSHDIRNASGAFRDIDYDSFILDLSELMKDAEYQIFSATIDMYEHARRYGDNAKHPYSLAMEFILERFARFFLLNKDKLGAVVFESRGKREDKDLLRHIRLILDVGTSFVSESVMQRIVSVHFNPKRTHNNLATYLGLEIADLTSYPIHKFCRCGKKDKAFMTIESKIHGYPACIGRGLKIFPNEK